MIENNRITISESTSVSSCVNSFMCALCSTTFLTTMHCPHRLLPLENTSEPSSVTLFRRIWTSKIVIRLNVSLAPRVFVGYGAVREICLQDFISARGRCVAEAMTRGFVDENRRTSEQTRHFEGARTGRDRIADRIDEEDRHASVDVGEAWEILRRWGNKAVHGQTDDAIENLSAYCMRQLRGWRLT